MSAIECRVINLDRRTDRLAEIGGRLDAAGISWIRHPACDASAQAPDALRAKIPGASRAYPMAHVERACALSHLEAWDAFLQGDAQALCVLEDDVLIHQALGRLLADDGWALPGLGVVKLDANSPKPRKSLVSHAEISLDLPGHKLWRLWSRRLGGGGYVLHRAVARRLVDWHARPQVPIDHCLFNPAYAPQFTDPGVHVIEPPLVFHDHNGSDMQAARQDQKRNRGWAVQKLAREFVGLGAVPARLHAMLKHGARFRVFAP